MGFCFGVTMKRWCPRNNGALLEQYQEATTELFELSRELSKVLGSYEMDAWQKA